MKGFGALFAGRRKRAPEAPRKHQAEKPPTEPAEPQTYTPTIRFAGDFINDNHRNWFARKRVPGKARIAHAIAGKLLPGDAAKIYELAFFSSGPTADIGTNFGLSAFVAACAIRDAGSGHAVHTVEINPRLAERAERNHVLHGTREIVEFHCGDAVEWLIAQHAADMRFGFIFVDHDHGYESVRALCDILPAVMLRGAYVAFHDFRHRRNRQPDESYGVARAVGDTLKEPIFRKCGISGCSGIFQFAPDR
jgi:predicted O-methyltransferase YrrM